MLHALLASILVLASGASALRSDPADVLREADRAFCRDTRERGLEGWVAWFADDAVLLPPAGPLVSGGAEVRAHFASQTGFPQKGFLWEPLEAGISAAGDFGWTSGRAGNDASGTPVWSPGRYLSVWQRQADGAWRVVSDLGGETGFASRLGGLRGPPVTFGREREHVIRSPSDDHFAVLGSWWASDEAGSEIGGRFLSVWRRNPDGTHELVIENGFPQPRR